MDNRHLVLSFLLCCISVDVAAEFSSSFQPDLDQSPIKTDVWEMLSEERLLGTVTEFLLAMQDRSYPCSTKCVGPPLTRVIANISAQVPMAIEPMAVVYTWQWDADECHLFQSAKQCLDQCPDGASKPALYVPVNSVLRFCSEKYKVVMEDKTCNFVPPSKSAIECQNSCELFHENGTALSNENQTVLSYLTTNISMESLGNFTTLMAKNLNCMLPCNVNYLKNEAKCNPQAVQVYYDTLKENLRSVVEFMEENGAPEENFQEVDRSDNSATSKNPATSENPAASHNPSTSNNPATMNQSSNGFLVLMHVIVTFFILLRA